MPLTLKEHHHWSLVIPTSMGVRLTPENRQPVEAGGAFRIHATSAESNVGSVSSSLGLSVKVLTNFVKGSPVARLIQQDLRSRNICFEGPEVEQGGPWGYRHQMNIADSGFGGRGPRVQNDRAGEVGRLLSAEDFDLKRIFETEGAAVVHLSGLIAALSPETGTFCLEVAREAKKHGSLISFDLNHRASLWKGREDELAHTFAEIASLADILVGNEEDFQLCLGIPGPEPGGRDLADKIRGFEEMIENARKQFPAAAVFATTLREVTDANSHKWGSIMFFENEWHIIRPREIAVLDRIGGGDGFVGGLLYGILKQWKPEAWNQFGWASGALAAGMLTDYARPVDEEQLWSMWEGNARVKR
ncbi:PfkB family carbohydrate kinase [Salinispira pacifica]|uniref:2-dehydro-3-deoxygluconate kinase n=1 Tax=Salinispira pacifica TaxID=1307761 RepID=V5WF41_9SPIO|nr:PfkB family carbohydrate kinase [Salinispira pacifica]AHC14159.1 2-dehydro-3-deoxygluconate kinase [Salinispira pacifica]